MIRGLKSSELWVLVSAVFLVVFQDRLGAQIPPELQSRIIEASMVYLLGRSGVKAVDRYKEKPDA